MPCNLRLSFSIESWLWQTGVERQPGPAHAEPALISRPPPRLFRRLRCKQKPPAESIPLTGSEGHRSLGAFPPFDGDADCVFVVDDVEDDDDNVDAVGLTGPCTNPAKGHVVIELKNVTSLKTHAAAMGNRRADLSLLVEHSLSPPALGAMRSTFHTDFKKQLLGTGLDPNCSHPTGGVGAICPRGDTLFIIEPLADSFLKQSKLGRVACFAYGKGKGSKLVHFYCIYGRSGGHGSATKAFQTGSIIQAIVDDISLRPHGAHFIAGDVNADVPDIPALHRLVSDEGWTDLGADAGQWGQPPNQPTCHTKGANQPNRRDYVFASPRAIQLVTHFQVSTADICPTHATLTFHLNTGDAGYHLYQARSPAPLESLLEQRFKLQYGFALNVQTDVDFFDAGWAADNPESAIPTAQTSDFIKSDKARVEEGLKLLHARFFQTYHQFLDYMLAASNGILTGFLSKGDTSAYWNLLWEIIEQCTIEFSGQAHEPHAIKHAGRGRNPVTLQYQTPLFSRELDGCFSGTEPRWIMNIAAQANRCRHLATCMSIHQRARAKPERLVALAKDIQQVKAATLKAIERELAKPGHITQGLQDDPLLRSKASDLRDVLTNDDVSSLKQTFALEHAASRYAAIHSAQLHKLQQSIIANRKAAKQGLQKSIGSMCRATKSTSATPIVRMRDGEGPDATIHTHPLEIDRIIRETMGSIYKGNIEQSRRPHLVNTFIRLFGQHFTRQQPFTLRPITGQELADAIIAMPDNAHGLDGVRKGDLLILSPHCLDLLAKLLDAVEQGAPWPWPVNQARTAFISKGEDDLSPQGFRGLAILSKLYRMWAAIRLRHCDDWVATWRDPGLFAGCNRPVGAEDAWFLEALSTEEARLTGQQVTGGSTDIWKCFDQVDIDFLCDLLKLAGCPTPITTAYASFHRSALYHNTVAGGLGEPHSHPCSIPQGCPLSMTMIAFLLSPWARYMRSLQVSPRALADDLLVTATGPGHLIRFKNGYSGTFKYLHCIGAKIAVKKCFTYSTDTYARAMLRGHFWVHIQAYLPCVTTSRDLGGQLNVGDTLCGSTLNERIAKATRQCDFLQRMNWDRPAKLRVVKALILPTALYGSEVAPPAERSLAGLSVSIAKAIGFYIEISKGGI